MCDAGGHALTLRHRRRRRRPVWCISLDVENDGQSVGMSTYGSVGGLLLLVALLVGLGLGIVRLLRLRVEGLPLLTELLADIACSMSVSC